MPVLGNLLRDLAASLEKVSDTPILDIQVAAAETLGVNRTWILAHPEIELSAEQEAAIRAVGHRMEIGEPLPYILEHWEFFGMDFRLSPAVLIPRPETELLVETALAWLESSKTAHQARLAADIGTGSGCIAVSLAAHVPALRVVASDISFEALEIARQNVTAHSLADCVYLVQADLLPPLSKPLNLLCANLPYIPARVLNNLAVARWEPRQALWGGQDGLVWISRLLHSLSGRDGSASPDALAPGALVLLEIEAALGMSALKLAFGNFPGAQIQLLKDLAGRDRLLRIELQA